jgi:hypothetical protein
LHLGLRAYVMANRSVSAAAKAATPLGPQPSRLAFGVAEFWHFSQLVLGRASQGDLVVWNIQFQALVRDRDEVAAHAEEAANLEDGKQDARVGVPNDKVVDRADLFILLVHYVAADQFGGPVALRNGMDINDDKFDLLCMEELWTRDRKHSESVAMAMVRSSVFMGFSGS